MCQIAYFLVFQYAGEIVLSKRLTIYHWTSQNFPIRLLSPSFFASSFNTRKMCMIPTVELSTKLWTWGIHSVEAQEREHDVELLERRFSLSLRIRWIPAACATSASATEGKRGEISAYAMRNNSRWASEKLEHHRAARCFNDGNITISFSFLCRARIYLNKSLVALWWSSMLAVFGARTHLVSSIIAFLLTFSCFRLNCDAFAAIWRWVAKHFHILFGASLRRSAVHFVGGSLRTRRERHIENLRTIYYCFLIYQHFLLYATKWALRRV